MMDYREAMQILRAHKLHAPAIVRIPGEFGYHIYSQMKRVSRGLTIEAAMSEGGFLPAPPYNPALFIADGLNVHWRSRPVCTAQSKTLAQRIATALNEYNPDPKKAR
jgi:hypothetical protein